MNWLWTELDCLDVNVTDLKANSCFNVCGVIKTTQSQTHSETLPTTQIFQIFLVFFFDPKSEKGGVSSVGQGWDPTPSGGD